MTESSGPHPLVIVMPAYHAAKTIEKTYRDIDPALNAYVLLVDDASTDNTVEVARGLGLEVIVHPENRGYGANQKTCYRAALARGAEIVVMLHPDYQYDPTRVPALVAPIQAGEADMTLGSRLADGRAREGGMPLYKFIANRFLTTVENACMGQRFTDLHTGLRAYHRRVLETVPFENNADGFVFDSEFLFQARHFGFRIAEIPVSARYMDDASSTGFVTSVKYGTNTLIVAAKYLLHRGGVLRSPLFLPRQSADPRG